VEEKKSKRCVFFSFFFLLLCVCVWCVQKALLNSLSKARPEKKTKTRRVAVFFPREGELGEETRKKKKK